MFFRLLFLNNYTHPKNNTFKQIVQLIRFNVFKFVVYKCQHIEQLIALITWMNFWSRAINTHFSYNYWLSTLLFPRASPSLPSPLPRTRGGTTSRSPSTRHTWWKMQLVNMHRKNFLPEFQSVFKKEGNPGE